MIAEFDGIIQCVSVATLVAAVVFRMETSPGRITCTASGYPSPVISWVVPGSDDAHVIQPTTANQLQRWQVVSEVNATVGGNYTCIARNSVKETSRILLVEGSDSHFRSNDSVS